MIPNNSKFIMQAQMFLILKSQMEKSTIKNKLLENNKMVSQDEKDSQDRRVPLEWVVFRS